MTVHTQVALPGKDGRKQTILNRCYSPHLMHDERCSDATVMRAVEEPTEHRRIECRRIESKRIESHILLRNCGPRR